MKKLLLFTFLMGALFFGSKAQELSTLPEYPAGSILDTDRLVIFRGSSNIWHLPWSRFNDEFQGLDSDLTIFANITPSSDVQNILNASNYSEINTLLGISGGAGSQDIESVLTVGNDANGANINDLNLLQVDIISMSGTSRTITNLADPTLSTGAATKNYVDVAVAAASGGTTQNIESVLTVGNDANGANINDLNLLQVDIISMTGTSRTITNLTDPTLSTGAATKNYVDVAVAAASGGTSQDLESVLTMGYNANGLPMAEIGQIELESGPTTYGIDLSARRIIDVADPTAAQDAATKNYVDTELAAASSTDDQTLSFDGTNITIESGNIIDISSIDTDTDDQTLTEVLTEGNSAGSLTITNLADPINNQDAATKAHVSSTITSRLAAHTINDDDWAGTDLALNNGGTGASNAADARANLVLGTSDDVVFNNANLEDVTASTVTARSFTIDDFSLDNASYTSNSFDVSTQDGTPVGITFNEDLSKMYMIANDNNFFYEYNLSTAGDVSTASYSGNSFDPSLAGVWNSMYLKADGLKMYGGYTGNLYEYDLSTADDISTASLNQNISFITLTSGEPFGSMSTAIGGMTFNADGTILFGCNGAKVFWFDLSSAWDISTASYTNGNFYTLNTAQARGIAFNETGNTLIVGTNNSGYVEQYNLNFPYDLSTASYVQSFTTSGEVAAGRDLDVRGSKFYFIGSTNDEVYEYDVASSNLVTSSSPTRIIKATSTLDFASTSAQNSDDLTVSIAGAELGDIISIGVPHGSVNANSSYSAWVSATGTVTVRFNNYSSGAIDPASGDFKVAIIK